MAGKEQYTAQQMIDALLATRGMTTLAAKRLGCSWNTVNRYIEKYPTVKAAQIEAQEQSGDMVELKLLERVQAGDTTAIIFALKTRYRDRGYNERLDIGFDVAQLKEFNEAMRNLGKDPADILRKMTDRARSEQRLQ